MDSWVRSVVSWRVMPRGKQHAGTAAPEHPARELSESHPPTRVRLGARTRRATYCSSRQLAPLASHHSAQVGGHLLGTCHDPFACERALLGAIEGELRVDLLAVTVVGVVTGFSMGALEVYFVSCILLNFFL